MPIQRRSCRNLFVIVTLSAAATAAPLAPLAPPAHAAAQELPVLERERARLILEEVSGDAAYEHIRFMTRFHRPGGGSDGLWTVAEYYEARAREYGLSEVKLIKQSYTRPPWNARFADLWIVGPEPRRIASTLQSPLHLGDYSATADVTAELVDVGAAEPADLDGRDLSGKILLTYGPTSRVLEAAKAAGAAGVVWYPDPLESENAAYPDQLQWIRLPSDTADSGFVFGLSLRQGLELRERLARGDGPVKVRAVVDAGFDSGQGSEPWQVMVEAVIPGSEPALGQDIVLTGHLQEEATSANDDASGTASVLEVGRALGRLIEEGRLPRPRRNIRLWWVTEISSQRQYFADHPDAHQRMWVNINQDMVGANQAQDVMRKQNITRLPATRFHFFNDVVEAVIDYMVAANTSELAQQQAGSGFYPDPHLSHLGTRHRYNAGMIFFHNNTDHMPFNEQPIGVPAITFTNWPDNYIHSSDDQLWNIDRTQLGRNAAAVALIAYTMASADARSLPVLAAQTAGRGQERLARNLRLALSWIAADADKEAAYQRAMDQLRFAVERERLALTSLVEVDAKAKAMTDPLLVELQRGEERGAVQIGDLYRAVTGKEPPGERAPGDAERRLAQVRPALAAGPEEFLARRGDIEGVSGLHGLMAFEVLNAVNGERSGLDIYRFVAAEAREAGEHYYGTVTPEAVLAYLENVENAGLIRLR